MTSLRRPIAQLAAFAVAGVLAGVVVTNTLSVPVPGDTSEYSAQFTGVDGLRSGNDVTLAGVRVGRVEDVRYTTDGPRSTAVVEFSVQSNVRVAENISAAIRYGDMLGARYLALVAPAEPSGTLAVGASIPVDRTTPPVDLTALVNGFKPLFEAIDPAQVNALARSIVAAFQGESGTVDSLLAHVATVTGSLTDNEQVLTELIADLDSVVGTMNSHSEDIMRLVSGLTQMSKVVADRNAQLITVLDDGSETVNALSDLLTSGIGPIDTSLDDLDAMTDAWIPNTEQFDETMILLPELASSINHIGDYGGWLNLYTCNFTLKAGDMETNLFGGTHTKICA